MPPRMEIRDRISFLTNVRKRSRFAVAREVKKAIQANETLSGYSYTPLQKRIEMRHEVSHHMPLEDTEVSVEAGIRTVHDGQIIVTSGWIGVTHPLTKNIKNFLSIIAPLFDRRFKQHLSTGDREYMNLYLKQFFTKRSK